jgi:flagellar hook-associated protein 2
MTEEEKMQGMLKGDRNLERIFFQMRSIAYKTLDWDTTNSGDTMPEYTSLSQVGISSGDTGANYDNTMKGLLSINETELKNALENNFDDVYKLFSHSNSFEVAGETKYNKGIITQMKDYSFDVTKFGGYIDNVAGTSGTIGNQMMDLAKRMTNMIDQLQRKEFRYVQQFSAMEDAISKMNSQMSYVMNALG